MSTKVATVKTIRPVATKTNKTTKATKTTKTKAFVAPTFKGHTLAMFNLITKAGAKGLTHNQIQKFRDDNSLSGAYKILFRLRRIGLATKAFTIEIVGEGCRADRTYRLVKGVSKGQPAAWPKAFPARTAKPATKSKASKSSTPAVKSPKKASAKAPVKPAVKRPVKASKPSAKPATKPAASVENDDDVLDA